MSNRNHHLINAYRQLSRQADHYVLATIIETFGSTYQKAGARMLISETGELQGLLGGGCFERDLFEQARSVFETGRAKTVSYDMRAPDDVIWGLGLGCNGAVKILLQHLKAEDDYFPLNCIADIAETGASGILVSVFESSHTNFPVGLNQFLPASITDEPVGDDPFSATASPSVLQQKPHIETHVISGQTIKAFYEPLTPPWHLLILGAGPDAAPLVQCAKALGWRVTLADHRPGFLQHARFPEADRLLHCHPEDIHNETALNQFNALVLMTHNIEYDLRYLKSLADSVIPIIGLLGPGHRRDKLLQSLGDRSSRIASRVFGPVGLDIGAQTPEEIALSIMAGIHADLNGRTGLQLSRKISTADNHECCL